MRKIIGFILLVVSINSFGQNPANYQYRVVYERLRGLMPDSVLHIPRYNGVPSGLRGGSSTHDGAIAFDTLNGHLYGYRNSAWFRVANYADIPSATSQLFGHPSGDFNMGEDRYANFHGTRSFTLDSLFFGYISFKGSEGFSIGDYLTGVDMFRLNSVSGSQIFSQNGANYVQAENGVAQMVVGSGDSIVLNSVSGIVSVPNIPYNSSAGIVHLGLDTVAGSPTFNRLVRKTAGAGGGSGTVNTGAANKAAYYPSGGTTVDDWVGVEFGNTNLNTKITAQATTEVLLEGNLAASQTANAYTWKTSGGGILHELQADGDFNVDVNTFKVDAVNNRVSIGENGTPQTLLQVGEDGGASSAFGTGAQILVTNNGASAYITSLGAAGTEAFFGAESGQGTFGMLSNHPLLLRTNNTTRLTISTAGAVRFHQYGAGTFTGTPARYAAWESDGDMIEVTASSLKPALNKAITIESPSATEAIDMWQTPVAITVTSLKAILRGSSPSVTYNIRFGTDITSSTDVFTSNITCTSVTTGCSNSSGFNDATIPAGSFIWVVSTAMSGTVTSISLTLNYTED